MRIEQIERKNISELKLDKKNPRLNLITKPGETFDDLIRVVSAKKMINLMRDILSTGKLNILNNFGILEEGNIVIDGNRRLLALKLIKGQIKTENEEINIFLKSNDFSEINEWDGFVNVSIFKNREEANDAIEKNHTTSEQGITTLEWDTFSKRILKKDSLAIFLLERMSLYNIDPLEILLSTSNPNGIKYSGIERLFTSTLTKEALGYSIKKTETNVKNEIYFKELFINLINFSIKNKLNTQTVFNKIKTKTFLEAFINNLENNDIKIFAKNNNSPVIKHDSNKKSIIRKQIIAKNKGETKKENFKIQIINVNPYFKNISNFAKEANRLLRSFNSVKKIASLTIRPALEELMNICRQNKLIIDKEIKQEYETKNGEQDKYVFHKMISLINKSSIPKKDPKEWKRIKATIAFVDGNKETGTLISTASSYIHNLSHDITLSDYKKYWKIIMFLSEEVHSLIISKK